MKQNSRIYELIERGEIDPFSSLHKKGLTNIDWQNKDLGRRALEVHLNERTDQATRRYAQREKIADWVCSLADSKCSKVLDLFCGCGMFSKDFSARGFATYHGVDINPALIDAARERSSGPVTYDCADVLTYISETDLGDVTIVLLLYECINALGVGDASLLLRGIGLKCRPGTWVFGDIRQTAHFHGLRYEDIEDCIYLPAGFNGPAIREYGYSGRVFGNRYLCFPHNEGTVVSTHTLLELFDDDALGRLLSLTNLKLEQSTQLLTGMATDVPESANNLFFAARVCEPPL